MEPERQEVYERIPWETLEKKGSDRQWLLYAVAGSVVLGALAYSFIRNQPAEIPPPATAEAASAAVSSVPATTTTAVPVAPQASTVASPLVVAEADLYAVDPERLIDQAATHAEWFAVEFVSYDGSERSSKTLAGLLPAGSPLPEAPDGTQVFVDWARASTVIQTGPASFDIEVLVRSLVSSGEEGFLRQPARSLLVSVVVDDEDGPRVAGLPTLSVVEPSPGSDLGLTDLPEEVAAGVDAEVGEPVGGVVDVTGDWRIVVMSEGSDGVRRPVVVAP